MRIPALFALWVFSLHWLGGCTSSMSMKRAPELAAVGAMPVTDRNRWKKPMGFGSWLVTVQPKYRSQGWRFGISPGFMPAKSELSMTAEQARLEFQLTSTSSQTTSADCLAQGKFAAVTTWHSRTTNETGITLPGFPRLDCGFSGAQTGTLTLRPDFATQRDFGSFEIGSRHWVVRSVNTLQEQRGSFPLARFGYELVLGERVVAAVETIGYGRIWMHPELSQPQQEEAAIAMTALLYYSTLLDTLDT